VEKREWEDAPKASQETVPMMRWDGLTRRMEKLNCFGLPMRLSRRTRRKLRAGGGQQESRKGKRRGKNVLDELSVRRDTRNARPQLHRTLLDHRRWLRLFQAQLDRELDLNAVGENGFVVRDDVELELRDRDGLLLHLATEGRFAVGAGRVSALHSRERRERRAYRQRMTSSLSGWASRTSSKDLIPLSTRTL
jgi:hypothetical protein